MPSYIAFVGSLPVTVTQKVDRLLRRQRLLAWALTIATVLTTATFFALLSLDAPILGRIIYGRAVTLANVTAVIIILLLLLSITLFGRRARRIDAHLHAGKRE